MVSNSCYSFRSPTINNKPLIHSSSSVPSFTSCSLNSISFSSSKSKLVVLTKKHSDSDILPILHSRSSLLRDELITPRKKLQEEEEEVKEMTIKPVVRIAERKLIVKDRTILTGVPDNLITTSGSTSGPVEGVFIGAAFDEENSRHVLPIGALRDVRFLACFRFKLWWMAQKMGDHGSEIPLETQFLLVETKEGSHIESDDGNEDNQIVYTVFLPLIEGSFRACLQGNANDELELCLESGDSDTKASSFSHSLFVHAGTDPFGTITEAIRAVKLHLKTFRQRHEKKLPGIVDYFGWCTWDAFYQEVTQEGVEAGLESLAKGGTPPKFVIIDDGWQSVGGDDHSSNDENEKKQQPLMRLTGIKENEKFQKKEDPKTGIKNIVDIAKTKHGLKYVYVWHAITGYWGGVRPGIKEMEEYESLMKYPMLSKGVVENEPTWKTDVMAVQGLGLVNPKNVYKFYNELHSYLASAGIDGVKVDVQCILETLGAGLGGRVELTRQYHQALDASVARNFPDNGCIACMSHNTDALYCSKQTAIVRASDDFYPRDPTSHTIHIAAVAYNSVFLGEIMQPDWDMFHSLHPAAEYHGSARAISGGPIYVSLLKIWNMNKYTGVLGVYNCQGAAWNKTERKNTFHETTSDAITGQIRGRDVHLIAEAATDPNWTGDCAIYCHRTGELITLPYNAAMPVSLKVLEHEIFTVTPIKVLSPGFSFAPLGLVNMFNAGGAIEGLKYVVEGGAKLTEIDDGYGGDQRAENCSNELVGKVSMEVKGCGKFGAYASAKPRRCTVDSNEVEFEYDSNSGLVTFGLEKLPDEDKKVHFVDVAL
ncbi:hypothetical protein WN944_002585 [Citrus x changshan-huyou]|uniref:galactinol--sucrose galactosyltransferase n=1 Tax=Citrus x changshan-huyou TaxID=2935761 RepID=A0AAP0MIU2_9ROSI